MYYQYFNVNLPVWKTENTAVEIRCADHATPSIPKNFALSSPTSGGRSVGIVRSRTKATEFFFVQCESYKKKRVLCCRHTKG
jgi:hypothetical protein